MNKDSLLAECHDLALQIAPELRERPLYVLDAAEVDAPRGRCFGWANTDEVYPSVAASLGEPGPLVVVDVQEIQRQAKPERLKECALAVALHELGHILPGRAPAQSVALRPAFQAWRQKLAARSLEDAAAVSLEEDVHHGPKFIRRLAHIFCRALAAGAAESLPCDFLLSQPVRFESYLPLFAGEVLRMQNKSFEEIEALPMSAAVTEQFSTDVEFSRRFGL